MENNTEVKTNTILIPTDFSEVCSNAIHHGAGIARYLSYKVCLLHVVNKDTKTYLKKNNLPDDFLERKLEEDINNLKQEYGIEAEYFIREGNIFSLIAEVAEDINAKLIILGTHGKVGFQRLTGSYAVKVITNTDVPTIVVQKKTYNNGYQNILFPVSVSTKDRQKVNWAVYMAKTFNSTIHLFPKYESDKYLKKKIMTIVKTIKTIFDQNHVKYVDKVSDEGGGNYAKQLIDYAVVNEADLIMIMTSTDSLLPVFDNWAEQIIFNSSQIPVICINPVNVSVLSWH
jgi:nucleotide-binding universal stress UspA family protein